MRFVHTLAGSLLLILPLACGNALSKSALSPLDFAEIDAHDGWYLRVHGDGSGSLTHRQYPHHHLDYPAGTFELQPLAKLTGRCGRVTTSAACHSLRYYRAKTDTTRSCACTDEKSVGASMTTAIASMQVAVDDGGSERSCRMLRRVWFAGR